MGNLKRRISRFLIDKFYHKLWIKIAVVLVLITNIFVFVLGFSLINISQLAIKNSVLNNHREFIKKAAEEIGMFVKESEDMLRYTAALLDLNHSGSWQQETILVELVLQQPELVKAAVFDLSARMIVSSDLSRGSNGNYSEEAIRQIIEKKMYISQLKFQDNHTPYVTMAVPIKRKGKIDGALMADVNVREIWAIVDSLRLGDTGRAFLVAGDGTLIAHPDKKRVLKNENLKGQKDIDSVLTGKSGVIELQAERGKKWISSYAPVPFTGWGIVVRQAQGEAYSFSRIMKIYTWAILFFSEIIAVLLSIFMAKIFVKPLHMLLSWIKNRTRSITENTGGKKRHDELGELSKEFIGLSRKLEVAKRNENFSSIGEAAVWMVHELKNSLIPIKWLIQAFPLKHNDDKFMDNFSQVIPEEINRCENMLKELSDFSASSKLALNTINITDVLDSVLKIMGDKFSSQKVELRLHVENNSLYVLGDFGKLEQVFINIIMNAVAAMPDGGILAISIESEKPSKMPRDSHLEITVSDTGIGISRERLKNIFEPFRSTKKNGVGLGLTISRNIVEQHGGDIHIESELGAGTTCKVRLPLNAGMSAETDSKRGLKR